MRNTISVMVMMILFFSCKEKEARTSNEDKNLSFREKLEKVSDSVKVKGIVVKNLFKYQILAHKSNDFDSVMIVEKVYYPHKELWDNCYGMIFGDENASKFNTAKGMIAWNKTLYPENEDFFDQRTKELLQIDLNTVLKSNLKKFGEFVPYTPKARISILFTPMLGIGLGGCNKDQFCFELNNTDFDVTYTIEKGIPHELNHLVYEPIRENDPKKNTALRQAIDEGFACYFTWLFFNKEIPKYEAVENMTQEDWNWYVKNEKRIYQTVKPYFDDESGDNPLLQHDKYKLFKEAPKTLYYWLGFKIIESYIREYGEDSWKDIYTMNVQEVLKKSKYEEYVNKLN